MVTAYFSKKFTEGWLKGEEVDERMKFVSKKAAIAWRDGINAKNRAGRLPYEVLRFEVS